MDLNTGQTATRKLTVTADMVSKYAEITGDYNPLHFDESFASRTRFKTLMAPGGITTGYCTPLWRWICRARGRYSSTSSRPAPGRVHRRHDTRRGKGHVRTLVANSGRLVVDGDEPERSGGSPRRGDGMSGRAA